MIPGIVVDLIKRMIVIGRRIEGGCKSLCIYSQRLVTLGQEVVTIITIRITRTCSSRITTPPYRSDSMEQASPVHRTRRHLLQVVGLSQIVG